MLQQSFFLDNKMTHIEETDKLRSIVAALLDRFKAKGILTEIDIKTIVDQGKAA